MESITLTLVAAVLTQSSTATPATTGAAVNPSSSVVPAAPVLPPVASEGAPHFDFAARAWFARLNGTINAPSSAPPVTIEDDFDLDDPQVVPLLTATARWDALALVVNGFWSSTDGSTLAPEAGQFGSVAFSAGDALSSSADAWGVAGDIVITFYRPYAADRHPWMGDDAPAGARRPFADLRFNGLVGGHAVSYEQSVTDRTTTASDSIDLSVITPVIGGGIELDLDLRRNVDWLGHLRIAATAGWGPGVESGDSLWFVRADLSLDVLHNLAITGGYRLLNWDAADHGDSMSGSLQGLVAGLELRF
ncbi:MAG: hypothetical protein FJ270_00925 [Planctomycetes bacterium]|nr:hypothetical protein [Planctomycetota bacterium]